MATFYPHGSHMVSTSVPAGIGSILVHTMITRTMSCGHSFWYRRFDDKAFFCFAINLTDNTVTYVLIRQEF